MNEMTPRERFELRKAILTTFTQSAAVGFVHTTNVTRWVQGHEQIIRKGWVSWLTLRDNQAAIESGDFDKAVPCNHVHSSKSAAIKCATQRYNTLPE